MMDPVLKAKMLDNQEHFAAIMAIEPEIKDPNTTTEQLRSYYQALKESYKERTGKKLQALAESVLMPTIRMIVESRGEVL